MTIYPPASGNWIGVAYRRGSPQPSPNTTYYFCGIAHLTVPGYLLSTRSMLAGQALVDVPSGYTSSNARQLEYCVTTDSNGNIPNPPLPMIGADTALGSPPVFATDAQAVSKTDKYKTVTPSNLRPCSPIPAPSEPRRPARASSRPSAPTRSQAAWSPAELP